jgi:prepilin signal peptidase PulO-like enzyme (type II secretory pathway)
MSNMFTTYHIVFIFILGAVFGSFLNVVIFRLPRGISLIWPPSACPDCCTRIKFYDNIPLLSYLLLLGKCRHCRTRISIRYPLVELASGLLLVWVMLAGGPPGRAVVRSALSWVSSIPPSRSLNLYLGFLSVGAFCLQWGTFISGLEVWRVLEEVTSNSPR